MTKDKTKKNKKITFDFTIGFEIPENPDTNNICYDIEKIQEIMKEKGFDVWFYKEGFMATLKNEK